MVHGLIGHYISGCAMLCPFLLHRPTYPTEPCGKCANQPVVNDGLRKLADDFTRAFQQTQWGVNGRVQPRFFDDSFVFRTSMLESGKKRKTTCNLVHV